MWKPSNLTSESILKFQPWRWGLARGMLSLFHFWKQNYSVILGNNIFYDMVSIFVPKILLEIPHKFCFNLDNTTKIRK